MITPDNLQDVIALLKKNHGSYAQASKVTGVSPAYFSRVATGGLQPTDIRSAMKEKLLRGLTPQQREDLAGTTPHSVLMESQTEYLRSTPDDYITEWLASLSPKQFDALKTIIEMVKPE